MTGFLAKATPTENQLASTMPTIGPIISRYTPTQNTTQNPKPRTSSVGARDCFKRSSRCVFGDKGCFRTGHLPLYSIFMSYICRIYVVFIAYLYNMYLYLNARQNPSLLPANGKRIHLYPGERGEGFLGRSPSVPKSLSP